MNLGLNQLIFRSHFFLVRENVHPWYKKQTKNLSL